MAAERFCIRNSGATAVVEGLGDHGCEYMTGGTVVILGPIGRNFGAGMSGGVAYVYGAKAGSFLGNFNTEMVSVESVLEADSDVEKLKNIIHQHFDSTKSSIACQILENWMTEITQFMRVIPTEYKEMLSSTPNRSG